MGAALGFIDDYLEESHVVSTHVELLDPCVGNLLAFGKAVDAENKSTRLIDTAVYAMGPIGADLGVGAVVEGPVELEGVKGVKVGVLGIEGGGMMAEFGSKIRQICGTGRGSGESAKGESSDYSLSMGSAPLYLRTVSYSESSRPHCSRYYSISTNPAAVTPSWPHEPIRRETASEY